MEWWRDFFDDDYLFLYAHELDPVRTEHEVAGIARMLQLREGARILDLCCGNGRHSVALHRRGYAVVGVDASEVLLRRARERARRILSEDDPGPAWVRADARALPLGARFDGVVLLFNSIGYGSDADTLAMLAQARSALRPAGQLLLECVHRDGLVLYMQGAAQLADVDIGGTAVDMESRIDAVEGVVRAVFRWTREGERRMRELRHRLYTASEIVALLREAGFSRFELRGGYDGQDFALERPLLLAHARV